ncbi:Uncharacterised protein at_DN2579 [Pycnogonum litorale]
MQRVSQAKNLLQGFQFPETEYFNEDSRHVETCKATASKHLAIATERAKDSFFNSNCGLRDKLGGDFIAYSRSIRMLELEQAVESLKSAQGARVRSDPKAILQIPFVVLETGGTSQDVLDMDDKGPYMGWAEHAVFSAFQEAFSKAEDSPSFFKTDPRKEEDLALMAPADREKDELDFKPNRMKFRRVKIELGAQEKEHLACLGVGGKKYDQKGSIVAAYRDQRKKAFSLETDVDDVDDFLNDPMYFRQETWPLGVHEYGMDEVLSAAINTTSVNASDVKFRMSRIKRFRKSLIGRWLHMISNISTELTVSLLQHSKEGEWILKKVTGMKLYMLVRPTDSSKHLFYCLLWRNENMLAHSESTVFKKINTNGVVSWTDVVSVNKSKLVNLVKAESQGTANWFMACEHAKLRLIMGEDLSSSGNKAVNDRVRIARKSFLVSTLVTLHDKSSVDDAMSNARFMCMEGFKSFPQVPDPGKRIDGLAINCKSRLEVWVVSRLIETSRRIIETFGFSTSFDSDKETEKVPKWINMFDPFTLEPIEDAHQLLSSFYYNFGKNKNESPENNTTSKLLTKILEYEDKLPLTKDYMGSKDRPDADYKFHEFSPSLLESMLLVSSDLLESQMGRGWKSQLTSKVIEDMSELNLESMATLKASSAYTPEDMLDHRPKVMEALKVFWTGTDAVTPLELAQKAWNQLQGALYIDLFKKAQHGGIREIYVLSIASRILQSLIECMSTTICKQFPSEIMTHPKLKLTTPSSHSYRNRKANGSTVTSTFCTSDDASKWNQGHFVTKFSQMLKHFVDDPLHPFIECVLSLWNQKKIAIPKEMLVAMDKMSVQEVKENDVGDSYFKRIHSCYKGESREPWMEPGASHITTKTGMLQGILHYTSSLFHTVLQEYMKKITMAKLNKAIGSEGKVVVDIMQSSDDSGMMISAPTPTKELYLKMYAMSCACFHLKYELGKMLGIYNSTKSTTGTVNIFEFNSEFFVHGSLLRPTWKWVHACLNLPEVDSMYGRQEALYNLLTPILEGGGSLILTSFCQMAQAYLFYRLMGFSLSSAWSAYIQSILKMPDPTLGFFCLDNMRGAGMGGMKYSLWKCCKSSRAVSAKIRFVLGSTANQRSNASAESKVPLQDIMDVVSSGTLTHNSIVNYGNKKKWERLLRSLNLPEGWEEEVEKRPEILYRSAQSAAELDIKLAVKAHSPGVSQSLSKSNEITRMIASSVYILSRTVLRVMGSWEDNPYPNTVCKTTLLRKLMLDTENALNLEPLTLSDEVILFPLCESYQLFDDVMDRTTITGEHYEGRKKKVRSDVTVFSTDLAADFSLEKVLKSIWFEMPLPASKRYRDQLFEQYKTCFSWIRNTAEETLFASPFSDHIQLQNFLSRNDLRDRVVHLTGAPIKGRRGRAVLETAVYQNLWPNWKVKQVHSEAGMESTEITGVLAQTLYMLAMSPLEGEQLSGFCREALEKSHDLPLPSNPIPKSSKVLLYLIQKGLRSEKERPDEAERLRKEWLTSCHLLSTGTMGIYLKRQKWENGAYKGKGIWVGRMDESLLRIELEDRGGVTVVTKIIVKDPKKFMESLPSFRQWASENHAHTNRVSYFSSDLETLHFKILDGRISNIAGGGAPVVTSKAITLLEIDDRWMPQTFNLFVDKHAIRLQTEVGIDESEGVEGRDYARVTLLSCPMSKLEIRVGPIIAAEVPIKNSFWRTWCSLTPLASRTVNALLNDIITDEMGAWKRLRLRDSKAAHIWLSNLFWLSASISGVCSLSKNMIMTNLEFAPPTDDAIAEAHELMETMGTDFSFDDDDEEDYFGFTDDDGALEMLDADFTSVEQEMGDLFMVSRISGAEDRFSQVRKPLISNWALETFTPHTGKLKDLRMFLDSGRYTQILEEDMPKLMYLTRRDNSQVQKVTDVPKVLAPVSVEELEDLYS